jgi:hypothetical protein
MRKMLFLFLVIGSLAFLSCEKNQVKSEEGEHPNEILLSEEDEYFVFGHYFGMCQGEKCVEIFKISSEDLFEDSKDAYPDNRSHYIGEFTINRNDKYELVKDLPAIPDIMLNAPNTVLGCPDCSDGGGLYIEIHKDGETKYWLIDLQRVPEGLEEFVEDIEAKIKILE